MSVTSVFSVYVSQVTSGYIRLHQVKSVYVRGTRRGARQLYKTAFDQAQDKEPKKV